MTTAAVTGVLVVFLVLAFMALFWVIKHYKSTLVRSYQVNELDINDPIGSELKIIAMKLAAIQDASDEVDGPTLEHVKQSVALRKELVRLGRELKNNERRECVNLSSCEQKT